MAAVTSGALPPYHRAVIPISTATMAARTCSDRRVSNLPKPARCPAGRD